MNFSPEEINRLFPVAGVRVWTNGHIEIIRESKAGWAGRETPPSPRGEIKMLSRKSLRRMLMHAKLGSHKLHSMITLTYPQDWPGDGKTVKRDLNYILGVLRRKYGGQFDYLWFLEFQARGAPHIHLMTSHKLPPRSRRRLLWERWSWRVSGGDEQVRQKVIYVHHTREGARGWEKIRHGDGAARYAAKYAAKPQQKEVPEGFCDVGRFWGASRSLIGEPLAEMDTSETAIREALRLEGHVCAKSEVLPRMIYDTTSFKGVDSEF